ncbi:GNAT family N-acetyltransferase [Chryseobacterium paridis]|uniref:GNAT family N-acetyltransferase n=1 Tax=Chryseobacterium paridis TaxID=2800328 RepID=A0ABS1FXI9_9FLAO|nr:GNAT family N-acetyltransferase [Chryseobacterium paridis]MBK1897166.1 GNAT family N-acetyltransferase [Chryseobacterium paridis]
MKNIKKEEVSIANEILSNAFFDNKSVNYILKRKHDTLLISRLMTYSIKKAQLCGSIWLDDKNNACCILIDPLQPKVKTLYSLWLDVLLILQVVGISNIKKVMHKERVTEQFLPKSLNYIHLWFIGVDIKMQGRGIGYNFLNEIINYYKGKKDAICLETSTLVNLRFYKKLGFEIYHKEDFGFDFYFLIKHL